MSNKLVCFDLDGVLVDSKDIHFNALNMALADLDAKYVISKHEQDTVYEGLTTKSKLEILTATKGLPKSSYSFVWTSKQKYSSKMFLSISKDLELRNLILLLKENNIKVAVASNSIRETLNSCLSGLGIFDLIDYSLSNDDVNNPKPDSEIYDRCMSYFKSNPSDTVIFEDSRVGIESARSSGAHTIIVKSRKDLDLKKIKKAIGILNNKKSVNVLIPMAGNGKRFFEKGYADPKPMIRFLNKTMIEHVLDSIDIDGNYIFIIQMDHEIKYNMSDFLEKIKPGCSVVVIDGVTDGAARTTLSAKGLIDNDMPLVIANSDQIIKWNKQEFLESMKVNDGVIASFYSNSPKWSYAKHKNKIVEEVAEKMAISDTATVGVYGWKKGSDYVKYAESMIKKDIRTNNEFYVCPVFNEAISENKKISVFYVDEMHGVGTPEDLMEYISKYD